MEEMTSLERVTAYRSGKTVDRLPYSMGLGETIVNYYGYTNKEYLFSSKIMVDVESKILHEFGGDGMTFSINTRAFAEALGSKMRYVDRGYSTIEKYFLDINPVDNFESVDIYTAGRLSILLEAVKMAQERYRFFRSLPNELCLGNYKSRKVINLYVKETRDVYSDYGLLFEGNFRVCKSIL